MKRLTQPEEMDVSGPKTFGSIAILLIVPGVALLALAGSALLAVAAAGLLSPEGPVAFFQHLTGNAPRSLDPVSLERIDGFVFLFWGPVVAALVISLVALRGIAIRDALAVGGTLPAGVMLTAAALIAAMIAAEGALADLYPQLQNLFTLPGEPLAQVLAVLGAVVGAPVGEEILFRGLMYTSLRERWGYLPTIGVTSAVFAGMHFDPTGLYALLVLPSALLLGWLREKTGGIYAPIVAHAALNAAAVAILLVQHTVDV